MLDRNDILNPARIDLWLCIRSANHPHIFMESKLHPHPVSHMRLCRHIARLPLKLERKNHRYITFPLHRTAKL